MVSPQLFSRQDWITACHFHDLTEREILTEVAKRVRDVKSRAKNQQAHPLVLLDLDGTLYEVGPRTFFILREWGQSPESARFPQFRDAIEKMHESQIGYSIRDTFAALSFREAVDAQDVHAAFQSAKDFWTSRFFSSRYLAYDRAYAGAAQFTRNLHDLGAQIVYLTGRDEPDMGDGTRANLIRDGFPWNAERTHLLMKPAREVPDLQFKRSACDYLREHGTLIASFENEPPNVVAFQEIFPSAMHVFVDTYCSDHPAAAVQGLYRIKGF